MPLLFWKAIQEGKERGAREFDLGRSEIDNPGLVAFKNHLGDVLEAGLFQGCPARPIWRQRRGSRVDGLETPPGKRRICAHARFHAESGGQSPLSTRGLTSGFRDSGLGIRRGRRGLGDLFCEPRTPNPEPRLQCRTRSERERSVAQLLSLS